MESLGQEESDIKLLQAKVAFLETQVAALRRSSVETESEVRCKPLVSTTSPRKRKKKQERKQSINPCIVISFCS